MRLPDKIEGELRQLETQYTPHQHAGTTRFRALRWAIEDFIQRNELRWNSPQPKPVRVGSQEDWCA